MAFPKRSTAHLFSPFASISLPSILVWMMAIYVVVDLCMHLASSNHERIPRRVGKESQDSTHSESSEGGDGGEPNDDVGSDIANINKPCSTIEAFIDVWEGQIRIPHDPWNQLKWGLPPAECPVEGHLIELLDPLNNYRRGVALGFMNDLDDKTHLENWFLGTKENLNRAKRRVFIDLGANQFTTSISWFMTRYPVDFTEIYAFETNPSLLKLPIGWDEDSNWVEPGFYGWRKIKSRAGTVPSWLVDRVTTFTTAAGVKDSGTSTNITRFIKDQLKLKPDDTVIVKIDIEGAEWPILYDWVKDSEMPEIIDELFVELHYFHPDNNWGSVRQWSRTDATRMLAELRFKGFYVHYWD